MSVHRKARSTERAKSDLPSKFRVVFIRKRDLAIWGVSLTLCLCKSAHAEDAPPPLPNTSFGYVGLVEMPSARMAQDGEFSANVGYFQNNQRYDLSFQVTPWLQTSFLYAGQSNLLRAQFGPIEWDRSFYVKARLWDEAGLLPAVAVGLNDFVGTGDFSGEYVVASKQFGSFDTVVGLGWGALAGSNNFQNPLAILSKSFNTRTNTTTDQGQFSSSTYFRGPAGLFGGFDWRTPIDGLTLIAEYSSDDYSLQCGGGSFCPKSQVNFGAEYSVSDSARIGVQWLYGRSIGGTISVALEPTKDPFPVRIGPAVPPVRVRSEQEQRQAIANLVDSRSFPLIDMSFNVNNALVDDLFEHVSGVSDFAVQGRTLIVTVGKSTNISCETIATLVATHGTAFDRIVIQGTLHNQKCAIPRNQVEMAAQLESAAFISNEIMSTETQVSEIDAKSGSPAASHQDVAQNAERKIRADATEQRIVIRALLLGDSEATVYFSNLTYMHDADAIERLVRVLMQDAPANVEKFRLISVQNSEPMTEIDLLRGSLERNDEQMGNLNLFGSYDSVSYPDLQNPILTAAEHGTYPRFSWAIYPQFRQELFDPLNPLGVQFVGAAVAGLEILPNLFLSGEAEANIWNDFNANRPSDSVLPHVRTDYLKYYVTQGADGIGDLQASYQFRIAPDVFAMVKAGYLESMFAGVGGEALWRPLDQRWALGIDLYDVKQRNFDRLFGLQQYHVFTGHVSLYYASPWYNIDFAVRVGQYLAGDKGITLEVSRRFSTGVELGLFMTKTNVSSSQFGEGSFDKGIMIRIPLSTLLPVFTQSEWSEVIRTIQRDGGQRLDGDADLYEETRRDSLSEISLSEPDEH